MFQVVQQICRCFVEIFKDFTLQWKVKREFKITMESEKGNLRCSWFEEPPKAAPGSRRINIILGLSEPYI